RTARCHSTKLTSCLVQHPVSFIHPPSARSAGLLFSRNCSKAYTRNRGARLVPGAGCWHAVCFSKLMTRLGGVCKMEEGAMRGSRTMLIWGCLLALAGPAAAAYREIEVANGGSISGRVRVTGETHTLPPQPVFKQKETCGASMPDER